MEPIKKILNDIHERYGKYMNLLAHSERFDREYPNIQIPFLEISGIGWIPVIETLLKEANDWNSKCEKDQTITIEQIKEKFGTLRFDYMGGDARFRGMVDFAEKMTKFTCEQCGRTCKNAVQCTKCQASTGWGTGKDE